MSQDLAAERSFWACFLAQTPSAWFAPQCVQPASGVHCNDLCWQNNGLNCSIIYMDKFQSFLSVLINAKFNQVPENESSNSRNSGRAETLALPGEGFALVPWCQWPMPVRVKQEIETETARKGIWGQILAGKGSTRESVSRKTQILLLARWNLRFWPYFPYVQCFAWIQLPLGEEQSLIRTFLAPFEFISHFLAELYMTPFKKIIPTSYLLLEFLLSKWNDIS